MYDTVKPSCEQLSLERYYDKVLGCWTGKNIGGTLGAPFEGQREMNDVKFYVQDLKGKPAPNDDLDLQLIWLLAAERFGIFNINERILGEYWLSHITGPWNEYGVCKANMRNGLTPPLSGSCNNDQWRYSNGAWIRSEIWACVFPGSPDEAANFAYFDACCDHSGEGIYAELFTAAMQSAAFVLDNVREVIEVGLARIPADCRIARVVKLVCDHYDKGGDFASARAAVVKDSEDLGWFQAPGNIGFVIIGLLYGEGDFGRSVCLANNCGDDTDCTAGTVGALLGIMMGRSGIPSEWIAPIGEDIVTCSIATYNNSNCLQLPGTLAELSDRVVKLALAAMREHPALPRIAPGGDKLSAEYQGKLKDGKAVSGRIWNKSPFEMTFELPFGRLMVDYEGGPEVMPGEPKTLKLKIAEIRSVDQLASVKALLPETWRAEPSAECRFIIQMVKTGEGKITVIPGEFNEAYYYLPLEIRIADRFNPYIVYLPLQKRGAVNHQMPQVCQNFFDNNNRRCARNNSPVTP